MKKRRKVRRRGSLGYTSTSTGMIGSYAAKKTEGNVANTALKSAVEIALGAVAGAGLGAVSGKFALLTGVGLIVAGNYAGERSGIVKAAGVGAIAYGIAKAFDSSLSGTTGSTLGDIKERMKQFKDEAMHSFLLDRIFKKKDEKIPVDSASNDVAGLDFSSLDQFDELNQQYASEFRANQLQGSDDDDDPVSGSPEFAYSIIEDEPDFSKM